eukprot:CAMPEP_0171458132 /NCGR_PEP_ID=MMETSP0945-20130129/3935_1 /TAXON_ID=109269 /ORGANISM="Vaucheria litorea, Strain CCMP2940" /LENGTH=336 /DNA_ID=CAMNT_0011983883 /DNA_START=191 /DNA_END=1201 /DNA_ORIENTATION=-
MVATTRNEAVTSNNYRVATTIPNPDGKRVMDSWQFKVLDKLFSVPLFNFALFGIFRKQMVTKAESMGIPWTDFLRDLNGQMSELLKIQAAITDRSLETPAYYFAPIHAYKDGNLCWDSAMEEDLWSKLMIAPLFDNKRNGDVLMRRDWLDACRRNIAGAKVDSIVDLGCGTGLSLFMVQSMWPEAQLTGIDLSTFKLAIAQNKLQSKPFHVREKVTLVHGKAEDTSLPPNSFEFATICLVNHESPKWVSEAIFKEAYRILRPGGVFSILDLDKDNLEILLENPFVAAVYKQTEPYMSEYLSLNMPVALGEAGFELLEIRSSSPSHLALIARKPIDP